MAIYVQTARMIIAEHRNQPITGTILLIGRQSVYLTEQTALRLFEEENITPCLGYFIELDNSTVATAGSAFLTDRSFLSMLSDAKVIALDVSDYENAEIVHDLNEPLPEKYENTADFIINGSCLDNLFDPATAIKSLSRMLRPGGRMFSFELGTQAYGALVMYSPEWFFDFYAANNYDGCKIYVAHFDQDLNDDYDVYLWHPFHDKNGQPDQSPMRIDDGDFLLYVTAVKGINSTNDKTPIQAFYRMRQEPAANAHYLERAEHYKTSYPTIKIPTVPAEPWNKNDMTWKEVQYARLAGTFLRRWQGVSGRYLFRVGGRPAAGRHFTFIGTLRNRQAWGARVPPIYFAVPVWGDAYVRLFTEVTLPAQLSPGNVPVLRDFNRCQYHIYTTEDDYTAIRDSEGFKVLKTLISTAIHIIEPPKSSDERYDKKSEIYRAAIRRAAKDDAANILLNADIVLADGFIQRVQELLAAGKRVIELPGPRTVKDAVRKELLQHHRDQSGAIVIPPRRLAAMALEHLHPLEEMHFWEGPTHGRFHPSHLYWRVGKNNLLARCFHLYPIVVFPRDGAGAEEFGATIDDDLAERACPSPEDTHVVTNSDEMFCCELSAPDHYVGNMGERGNIDDVVTFCGRYGKERNAQLLNYKIRMVGGDEREEEWRRVEAESETVIDQMMAQWGRINGIRNGTLRSVRTNNAIGTEANRERHSISNDAIVALSSSSVSNSHRTAYHSLTVCEPASTDHDQTRRQAKRTHEEGQPSNAGDEPAIHIVVPVWGEAYVRLFTEISLPTQLSPNNIPSLANREQCHFHIFTTQNDYGSIFSSSAFGILAQCMHASIHLFEPPRDNNDVSERSAKREEAYRSAKRFADAVNAGMLLLSADIVVADGFLRTVQQLLAAGRRVIDLPGIRASKQPGLATLLQNYRTNTGEIVISLHRLSELAIASPSHS